MSVIIGGGQGFPLIQPEVDIDQYAHSFVEWVAHVKLFHWAADDYSKHKVLDELHEKLEEYGDKFVEIYVGIYKVKPDVKRSVTMRFAVIEPEKLMETMMSTIGMWRSQSDVHDTTLDNILQDLQGHVANALYLFRLN
jgi:hypothetical protein